MGSVVLGVAVEARGTRLRRRRRRRFVAVRVDVLLCVLQTPVFACSPVALLFLLLYRMSSL